MLKVGRQGGLPQSAIIPKYVVIIDAWGKARKNNPIIRECRKRLLKSAVHKDAYVLERA